jgi:hypothetical protein
MVMDAKERMKHYRARNLEAVRERDKLRKQKSRSIVTDNVTDSETQTIVTDNVTDVTPDSVAWFNEMSQRVWREVLEERFREELKKGIARFNDHGAGETPSPDPLQFVPALSPRVDIPCT